MFFEPPWAGPPRRDYTAQREVILADGAGRVVIRERVDGYHRYELWEPLIGAATYGTTREWGGQTWGLARTRRPAVALPVDEVARLIALMEHEHAERRRAMDLIRSTIPEIGLTSGVADCVYESRGAVLLFTDPAHRAAMRLTRSGGAA